MIIELRNKSTVFLENYMGKDLSVAKAAWVCTSAPDAENRQIKDANAVGNVINYLMKHRHGTPFEHAAMTFVVTAPIFVWREWHRHRIGQSYNEESARYKTLEPVFYIPPRDRPIMKVDNWKPGRPKFEVIPPDKDWLYQEIINDMKCGYEKEYERYLRQLERGVDPGLARDNLPVGIFSTCYVTCNPRSVMAFLSLRTHDITAKFVSYPLYEIEEVALKVEKLFAIRFPLTYKAFVENGRVAP